MKTLIQIIYASIANINFDDTNLIELLTEAREKNSHLNVTGMLLYCDYNFFQIIEGQERIIQTLFKNIKNDPRHKNVTTIVEEPIQSRSFAKWTMGFANATKAQLSMIEGMNDFFNEEKCLVNIKSGRAKKILNAFASGRWRLSDDTQFLNNRRKN
ncbi:BLUF domain-containing protein [Legionella drancourtii]|uniref:BLUF domain-containing protein n=1 Tax=Legionella drancourtii LLAP12 TaxID=658187 RepID=G9ETS2_9GAMM|nr:BLUF domain-containing protein [Legionella drancourtii]EHL29273.1 hypothetical protein LDG_8708 [Legionella drancourtii LLAP12]